jgi:hypothetical protein
LKKLNRKIQCYKNKMSARYQSESSSENFAAFCKVMTDAAENQLDAHREKYYPICVSQQLCKPWHHLTASLSWTERSIWPHYGLLRKPQTNE